MNKVEIKFAAESVLRDLNRTSFSGEGFSSQEIETISNAITAAIAAYDMQQKEKA